MRITFSVFSVFMYMKYKHTEKELRIAVKDSLSIADVCRKLNILPRGSNYKTLKSKFKKFNIDTSHFTGAAWNQGDRYRPINKKRNLSEVLKKNSPMTSTNHLKKRLINEKVKKHKCEICGITEWNGKEISLELDHINGDNTDNRIENLRILCPNCHSQTPNFRGRNQNKRKKSNRKQISNNKCNICNKNVRRKHNKYCSKNCYHKSKLSLKSKKKCATCKTLLNKKQNKFCSIKCYNRYRESLIPNKKEIINIFEKYKSFLQVGKHFNVSDNTVRKWCIKYNILDVVK